MRRICPLDPDDDPLEVDELDTYDDDEIGNNNPANGGVGGGPWQPIK